MTPDQIAALRAETLADPAGLGYAENVAAGQMGLLADKLNAVHASVTVHRADVRPEELVHAIDLADFETAPNPLYVAWFQALMQSAGGGRAQRTLRLKEPTGEDSLVFSNLKLLTTNGKGTGARLEAAASREGSRAEFLFGAGASVTYLDCAEAMRPELDKQHADAVLETVLQAQQEAAPDKAQEAAERVAAARLDVESATARAVVGVKV